MAKDKDNQNPQPEGKKPEGGQKPEKGGDKGQKGEPRPQGRGDKPRRGGDRQGKGGPKGGQPKKHEDSAAAAEALKPSGPPRLKTLYDEKVRGAVAEKFGIKNRMAQPRLEKITINVNMGR